MAEHELKVAQPYFDALVDGSKTFEVRYNDRGFQRGDTVRLIAVDSSGLKLYRELTALITFVYSGDPRWQDINRGYVVLGLGPVSGDSKETNP